MIVLGLENEREKNQMLDIREMARYMLLSYVNRSYDVMSRH